ncbi:acyl-CoA thioesterase [Actinophytocola sediminis]
MTAVLRPDLAAWRAHRSGSSTVDELVAALAVRRLGPDLFAGTSTALPAGRVFGGQTLAQCVVAAALTVAPPAVPHSLHGYFVRPGSPSRESRFTVSTIRDGRSFTTRRVEAAQDGEPTCAVIASFHVPEDGLTHQDPMPRRPGPDGLDGRTPFDPDGPLGAVELRPCPPTDGAPRAESAMWLRVTAPLPDDPLLHQALLVYLSDFGIVRGAFRLHGVTRPQVRTASLDHSMWLHRPGRADEWVLYDNRSPSSGNGRAVGFGTMYNAAGDLLATAGQEMLVRMAD